MAGVKGRSGPKQEKPWRDALMLAVNRAVTKGGDKAIHRIADAVVNAAIAGDMQAAKEIGDRLDGKARQEVEATVHQNHYVVESPAPAPTANEWLKQHVPTIQ